MKTLPFRACRVVATVAILSLLVFAARAEQPKASAGKIAAQLQPFVEHHTLAGAVMAVADKEKLLAVETVGYADIGAKKPMQADCLFWIASMSKPITGAALMILVDEGKVRVEDPVEKYLPEFKGQWVIAEQDESHVLLKKPARPITVADVLTHTSGLAFRSPMEQPTLDVLPLRDRVRSYAMLPLLFEPGTKSLYSNEGINTAGRIIEVASGLSYEEFLDQRLFLPLGMKDTTFWPNEEQLTRLAKSYKPNAEKNGLEETTISQLSYPLNNRERGPMPAGGLFSTATDVAKLCQMVLNGGELGGKRYLSPGAVTQMTSKQTGEGLPNQYGFGWATGGGTAGHGGAYSTNMTVDREHGLVMVWMVQHAGFPNGDEGKKVFPAFQTAARELFGKP